MQAWHEYVVEHIHPIVKQLDVFHLRLIQLIPTTTRHRALVHRSAVNPALLRTIEYLATMVTLERPFGRCLSIPVQKQTRREVRG